MAIALTLSLCVACGARPDGNSSYDSESSSGVSTEDSTATGGTSSESAPTDDSQSTSSVGDVFLENGMPNYDAMPTDEMIFAGWRAPQLTQQAYQEFADCGFNYIYLNGNHVGGANSANMETALTYCQNVGVKAFIDLGGYEDQAYQLANRYQSFTSFAGFNYDEPVIYDNTLNNRKGIINMSVYAQGLANNYANTALMVNLNPQEAVAYNWGTPTFTYEEYLETLVAYINTPYAESNSSAHNWISCDSYPLLYDSTKTPSYFLKDLWLQNLGYLAVTKRDGSVELTSNFFVKSMTQEDSANHNSGVFRVPTYEDMRLQVYTLMAFGYDSASFFCYASPLAGGMYEFAEGSHAMIDHNGNKTSIYTAVKNTISEIKKFSNTYMHFNDGWRGVWPVVGSSHGQKRTDYVNLEKLGVETQEMDSAIISQRTMERMGLLSVTATEDAVVGCMKDSYNNSGFMVVNYNDTSLNKTNSVEMTFQTESYTKAWVYIDGVQTEVALSDGKLILNLDAGEGVFVIPFKA